MTATEVKGFGRQKGYGRMDGDAERAVDFAPKVRLEVAISDALVARVVEAIQVATRTGKIGDGKIFVQTLEEVIRVRTGERGEEAL